VQIGELQRAGEGLEARRVRGRTVAEHPEQRQHARIALQPGEGAAARPFGGRAVDARDVAAQAIGRQPVAPCRVSHVDPHVVLLGWLESERVQPPGRSGAAPRGVHHEVGVDRFAGAGVGAPEHPDADHAPAVARGPQARDVAGRGEPNRRERSHPGPNPILEQRPASTHDPQPGCGAREAVPAE
jgi:hypothetical protein